MDERNLAVISIASVTGLFAFYNFLDHRKVITDLLKRYIPYLFKNESIEFAGEKSTGILFTGIIPFIIFVLILDIEPALLGLTVGKFTEFWYLYLLLPVIAVLSSFFISKNPVIQAGAPRLRLKNWELRHLLLTVACWVIYLLGYEFLFRGILWFTCYNAFGFWLALGINTVLYSAVHLPKGKFMAVGTIPLGILFCLLSHITCSFCLAFLIHVCMASAIEIFSLYHNPEFHIRFSKSSK